jgi:diguanylate cyclase (GGDEF)-like protein/PAS domain S-box-containing protein
VPKPSGIVSTSSLPPAADPPTPRRAWWRTLKARVTGVAALVAVLGMALGSHFVLHHTGQRSEQALLTLEADQTGRIASSLGQRVVAYQNMLRVAAERLPEGADRSAEAAKAYLQSKGALGVSFDGLFVADTRGVVLAALGAPRHPPGALLAEREYFRRTVAQRLPVVSKPMPATVGEENVAGALVQRPGPGGVLVLTAPVWDAQRRELRAVLGAVLRLEGRLMLEDINYGTESLHTGLRAGVKTIVTDEEGRIVAHPDPQRLLGAIADEPGLAVPVARWEEQGRPIEPEPSAVHLNAPAASWPWAGALAERARGQFVSMAGVPGAGWMVYRITPGDHLLGNMAQARKELLGWLLAVAALTAAAMLLAMQTLLRPLSQLTERARTLDDGRLDPELGWPDRGAAEIRELSDVLRSALRQHLADDASRRELLGRMRSLLALAPIGIVFTRERRIQLCSQEFAAMFGEPEAQLVGRHLGRLLPDAPAFERFHGLVTEAFARGESFVGEFELERADGTRLWARMQGRLIDAAQPLAGTLWLLQDVTETRATQERLSWRASHDPLTRLLNRTAFEERLQRWRNGAVQTEAAALICLDLDRFKPINDTAGHAAGDCVLQAVAAQLLHHVRGDDAVARLGGDEFALLLPGCSPAQAAELAERLRIAIGSIGVQHAGRRLNVGASLGVIDIPAGDAGSVADWLAAGDAACYAAKHAGRDTVHVGAPRLEEATA